MSSYLPEKAFVVCTMQMSPTKGQLLADPDRRDISVIHSKKEAALLTRVDLLLKDDFGCKNDWRGPISIGGFLGGLVAGAALVVLSVATLGVGAIVIGACAVVATVATYAYVKSNSTKCNTVLNSWQNPHPTVSFDHVAAVTQTSFITCGAGGMLQPFISPSAANSAARRIAWANRGEITVTGVISFMFGAAVGYTGGTVGLVAAGKETAIGIIGAYAIYAPASYGEKKGMRSWFKSDTGDTTYDRLIANQEATEQPEWFEFKYDSPDDDFNPIALGKQTKETFQRSKDIRLANRNNAYIERMMNVEGTRAQKEAAVEAIAREMSKTEQGKQIVDAMRRKGSGKIWVKSNKTRTKGNRVTAKHRTEARTARSRAVWGTKGSGFTDGLAFNGVALMLPLLVTPLDEYTIKAAADFADEDIANGSSVASTSH